MKKLFGRLSKAPQKDEAHAQTSFGVGTKIHQRYRLDAEIGRGGMGTIYRAHDILNDRKVAVKIINAATANALSLDQFKREMEISTKLQHPHIVTTHEAGTVDTDGKSLPFLVMELVQGTSLDKAGNLTYARIIDIARQVCDALAYIHDQGFVYRDLKPSNIILEPRGFQTFVKLLDFGLARPRGESYLPNESSLAGTVFYLAPELVNGEPADVGSDLYAFGAVLYEMITGRVPFSNVDEQTILTQHLNEQVAPPSQSRADVPSALESIVMRLLAKTPQERFGSAQEVGFALERISIAKTAAAIGNLPDAIPAAPQEPVTELIGLLTKSRLVTLLSNDETLVLAAASQTKDIFSDGIWLIQLTSIHDPARVMPTVMEVLNVSEIPNRPPVIALIEFLREKHLLLLLSHCGHLTGACVQLIKTILPACPEVRIVAVSTQALNLPEEICYKGTAH